MSFLQKLQDRILGNSSSSDIQNALAVFMSKKSVAKSTHFLVQNFALAGFKIPLEAFMIRDLTISIPQLDIESIGTHNNLYTFPVLKSNDPIKVTMTLDETENLQIIKLLKELRLAQINTNGRYSAPSKIKNIEFSIPIFKTDGTRVITYSVSGAFLNSFDELKYSYDNLTDTVKYSAVFICDYSGFDIT